MAKREYIPFNIPKRKNTCTSCQNPLQGGHPYFSLLCETPQEEPVREDYCSVCWSGQPKKEKIFWTGKVPESPLQVIQDASKKEKALFLLRDFANEVVEDKRALAFVLALCLERSKMISFKKEMWRNTDKAVLLYEVSETDEMIAVPKISLNAIDISSLQVQIADLLEGKSIKTTEVSITT